MPSGNGAPAPANQISGKLCFNLNKRRTFSFRRSWTGAARLTGHEPLCIELIFLFSCWRLQVPLVAPRFKKWRPLTVVTNERYRLLLSQYFLSTCTPQCATNNSSKYNLIFSMSTRCFILRHEAFRLAVCTKRNVVGLQIGK